MWKASPYKTFDHSPSRREAQQGVRKLDLVAHQPSSEARLKVLYIGIHGRPPARERDDKNAAVITVYQQEMVAEALRRPRAVGNVVPCSQRMPSTRLAPGNSAALALDCRRRHSGHHASTRRNYLRRRERPSESSLSSLGGRRRRFRFWCLRLLTRNTAVNSSTASTRMMISDDCM